MAIKEKSWFFATDGESRILLASSNKGKLKEIALLLREHILNLRPLSDFSSAEIEEVGASYRENALIKARTAFQLSGWASLADDSGFEVAALGGQPGLHSARWAEKAGGERDFSYAISRIEKKLAEKAVRSSEARFVCALALVRGDGEECVVQADVKGRVAFPPRGANGFGYDPIFVANANSDANFDANSDANFDGNFDGNANPEKMTFAEMPASEKELISHRAKAFKMLYDKCFAPQG